MNTEQIIENIYQELNTGGYGFNSREAHRLTIFIRKQIEQELSRLGEIDIENAAKHYAMTNYARAEKQSIEDASYIQDVSYHTFKGAIDWLKKLSLEEKNVTSGNITT